ncbi:hypothetical protein ACFOEK_06805 [Litoribrevibacter euphylliae]|uniref:Lipoprotein n=1 Tax=Litoribrevibacter euphylliae TaxID=1834034 RepID=A0ABV7HDE7_9GAMM
MRKLGLIISAVALMQGCSTTDLNKIATDAVSGAIDGVMNSAGGSGSMIPTGSNSRNYSVETESITTQTAKKTRKDYGAITIVRTEANPKKQTRLVLDSCTHPRIGNLRCGGHLFEVTPEGWLKDDPITFNDVNYPELTLAAGTYYIKAHNWDSGQNRFVTGEFTIEPFVTNMVSLELE